MKNHLQSNHIRKSMKLHLKVGPNKFRWIANTHLKHLQKISKSIQTFFALAASSSMTCSSWGSGCSTPSSPSGGTASGSVGGGGANPPASEGGGAGAAAGGEAEVDINRLWWGALSTTPWNVQISISRWV